MPPTLMSLKVLLPSQVFVAAAGVRQVVAETQEGSFGILPHRLDCVAALVPGILSYETAADGEMFVAIDDGILVKSGRDVLVSVRRALKGQDLSHLRAAIEQQFQVVDEGERSLRSVTAKLEAGLLKRLASLQNG